MELEALAMDADLNVDLAPGHSRPSLMKKDEKER